MTNFRHFQTERVSDNNFNFDEMAESSPKGWKTPWEKEKLLITSSSSFGKGLKPSRLYGKGLDTIPQNDVLT